MNKKCVSCANNAIIRLPYFSYDFYLKYIKNSKEILNIYDAFFKNNLLLTSKSLYHNVDNIANKKNKASIENSILKYMIRASTRTTPYSMLSMIAVSDFNQKDNCINNNKKVIIRPDYEWMIPVMHMIEKEIGYEMKVTLNNTIDVERDYIINNWVDCLYKDNNFDEKKIKVNNTKAVGIIIAKCNNCFISIQNIIENLQSEYPETDKKIFISFIYKLLKNEILISEFKQSAVGKDFFYDMINRLKRFNNNSLLIKLEEIYEYIQQFNKFNRFELIDIIENKMAKIKKVNNYLRVDCFYGDIINIPLESKCLIEDFVSFILSYSYFNDFDDFIMRFKDKYHNDAIQLKDFLKYNNDLVDVILNSKYQNQIEDHILIKLTNKLIENPHLKRISLEDLLDKKKKKSNFDKGSMEIPFFLLKNKLIYSPMFGSYLKGQSIGRFAYYLNNESMYNKDEVELCFYPSKSRILNVMDNFALKKRRLCYGTVNDINDLSIDDVYIYCDDDIYFVNSKTGEKIKFGINSKINKAFAPKYIQFIMTIVEKQNGHFFRVINSLTNVLTKLKEIPEIYYKDIIVFPKSWIINVEDYKKNKKILTFEDFAIRIKDDIRKRNIHDEVFIGNNDQRLLINLNNVNHLKIVYDLLKTSSILKLEKNMFSIDDLIIKDNEGMSYISEVIAQIDYGENIDRKKLNITDYIRQNDIYSNMKFFYNNWLSFKIYMDSLKMNDFIHNEMILFLKKMKYKKVISSFYFLRYKDPKEHIRIRIKYIDKNLHILMTELSFFVEMLRNKNLIYDFCIDTYFPEKSRYGGEKLFELSEELFFYDSILVSDLLDFNEINRNSYSIDELFILSSLEILRDLQIDKNELIKILEPFTLLNISKKSKKNLKERIIVKILSQQKKDIIYQDKKEDLDLYIIFSKVGNFIKKYGECLSGFEFEYKKDIVNSLIHMHHNRLIGINREKENYLMSVLESVIFSLNKRETYYEVE